jgi:hypothetical protein
MDKEKLELRGLFIPIAVVEHHQMPAPHLDVFDISDRLAGIWTEIKKETETSLFTLDTSSIFAINTRIAKSLNGEPGTFRNEEDWPPFIAACGRIEEDPAHVLSWMFSALYWRHLTQFRISTAWLFVNALRLQHGFSTYRLSMNKLGAFLDSLSSSGPPIYDGQTFYLEDYS